MRRRRARLARRIVKWIASPMDHSYWAHENGQVELADAWADIFKWRQRIGLKLALRLDWNAATDQMVCEGWWG